MWNLIHGSPDDLRALSTGIHDRGMYLMVDAVANRMGYAGPSHHVDYSRVVQFNSNSYFHSYCPITNSDDQANVENCCLGDDTLSLPDVDTSRGIFNS
ncbi:hypothetical protein PABG_03167 [Paracoccidioides brasiliensis Pb03]|nr:hypothetical protein PABG_03167 [Paracoccidioides brasiliensis Pb03]